MIITLDGPSGSGKSTLASMLAKRLNFFYLNSGFLYRSLAYVLVKYYHYNEEMLRDLNLDDVLEVFDPKNFKYKYVDGYASTYFKGDDLTPYLKDVDVSKHASIVALHPYTRRAIVPFQQYYGRHHDLVCDGRDGGTEIFPHAEYKFFVNADVKVRACRLVTDVVASGKVMSYEKALEKTEARDERDRNRKVAPLRKADDAIDVDTSTATIEETLQFILARINK